MRVVIQCPLPPTLNDIIWLAGQLKHNRRNGQVLGSLYSDFKKKWGEYIFSQIETGLAKQGLMIDGEPWAEVWVTAEFWTTDAMDPVDNLPASLKLIMDALTPAKDSSGGGYAKLGLNLIKDDNRSTIKQFVPLFHHCKRGEEKVHLTVSDRPQYHILPIVDPNEAIIYLECSADVAPPRRVDRNTKKTKRGRGRTPKAS